MNSILIVLPILTLLMFDLGLTLEGKDFLLVLKRFKAFTAGLAGQIIILPLIAWGIASLLNLSPKVPAMSSPSWRREMLHFQSP